MLTGCRIWVKLVPSVTLRGGAGGGSELNITSYEYDVKCTKFSLEMLHKGMRLIRRIWYLGCFGVGEVGNITNVDLHSAYD